MKDKKESCASVVEDSEQNFIQQSYLGNLGLTVQFIQGCVLFARGGIT